MKRKDVWFTEISIFSNIDSSVCTIKQAAVKSEWQMLCIQSEQVLSRYEQEKERKSSKKENYKGKIIYSIYLLLQVWTILFKRSVEVILIFFSLSRVNSVTWRFFYLLLKLFHSSLMIRYLHLSATQGPIYE